MGKVPVILCDSHEFWSLHHLIPNYNASEQPTKTINRHKRSQSKNHTANVLYLVIKKGIIIITKYYSILYVSNTHNNKASSCKKKSAIEIL